MKTGTTEYHKFRSAMHANLLFEAVDPLLRSHLIMHPDYRYLVHPAKQHEWNVKKILTALSVLELEPAYAQSKRAKDNEAAARNKAVKVQSNAIAALEAQVQVFATQMFQHKNEKSSRGGDGSQRRQGRARGTKHRPRTGPTSATNLKISTQTLRLIKWRSIPFRRPRGPVRRSLGPTETCTYHILAKRDDILAKRDGRTKRTPATY